MRWGWDKLVLLCADFSTDPVVRPEQEEGGKDGPRSSKRSTSPFERLGCAVPRGNFISFRNPGQGTEHVCDRNSVRIMAVAEVA